MPAKKPKATKGPVPDAEEVVASLRKLATKKTLDGFARYAIPSKGAFGVAMGDIQNLAKSIGRDHDLSLALWQTGWYEARLITAYIDEPDKVTSSQMDRWCRDFDNWGICDTICFALFDRTPFAFEKIVKWSASKEEFVKRAAFALLASIGVHNKKLPDSDFIAFLPLIEKGAYDERNFVKKGVSWALRVVGRRSLGLHGPCLELAARLGEQDHRGARWVGKDAHRELSQPRIVEKLKAKARK